VYRARQIAKKLVDHDIIALCETFDPQGLGVLVASLQEFSGNAFHVVSSPLPANDYLLSGGCLLLSKYSIESADAITFSKSSTFWSHGIFADGFAAKGALLVRIRLPGDAQSATLLNCLVTHLEARSAECRAQQIGELADFLRLHDEGKPFVLLGDLNTQADDRAAYGSLRDRFTINGTRLRDAWEEMRGFGGGTSEPLSDAGGKRIDYILYSPGYGKPHIRLAGIDVFQLRNKQVGSLSDHAAVSATFRIHCD
jgi:endonuclease/exonuclease/phosphatase family metal-dependent hydrolase